MKDVANPDEVLLVLTTLPDRASAHTLAQGLIENHLAACVNILAECTSIYRWEGKVEQAGEVPLLIKVTRAGYPDLQAWIGAHHPYTLPEIIALPVTTGLPAYLQWVANKSL